MIGSRRHPLSPAQVVHRAIVGVAILLPYLAWTQGTAAKRVVINWRCRLEARQAEKTRLAGHPEAALSTCMHLYDRAPSEPEVIRGIAWSAAPSFPVQARHFLEKLVEAKAATPEDQMLLAALCTAINEPVQAASIYKSLVASHPRNPDVWRSWAAASHRVGDFTEAMNAWHHVLACAPHDPQATVGVADLLLRSGTEKDQKAAVQLLLGQLRRAAGARLPGANDLAAALVALPVKDASPRSEIAAEIRQMPDAPPEVRAAGIILAYPPEPTPAEHRARRDELRAFLAANRTLDVPERRAVSLLLQKKGESALLLDWTSLAQAAGDPVLFAQRLDALLACGQWKEAVEMVRDPAADEAFGGQTWMKALVVLHSGRSPAAMAESLLTQSLEDALGGRHVTACNAIGFAALDYGFYPLAAHAFAKAAENGAAVPLEEYFHAARRSGGSADEVMGVIRAASRADPGDDDMLAKSVYLRLLCGSEIERAALDLARLRQRAPDDPYLKFLNAFTGYRLGDHRGAVKALLPLPSRRWPQGETVVISTILAAGGQLRQAAELAAKISGEGVFPEEKQLLDSWQSRAQSDARLLGSVTMNP